MKKPNGSRKKPPEHYETAIDIVVTLSLTGLRQGEARALRWSDWNEKEEMFLISRAIWHTHIGDTKTPSSEDTIPVLPRLAELLRNRRKRVEPEAHDFVFAGERLKTALNFHNVETQIIKPALKNSGMDWRGFHGFRRGLSTNLLELQVDPVTVARILRHGDVAVTLGFYAKARDAESRAAMDKLEASIRNRNKAGVVISAKESGSR